MPHRLRRQGHLSHEAERRHKVGKAQLTTQFAVHQTPGRQVLGESFELLRTQGNGGHGG